MNKLISTSLFAAVAALAGTPQETRAGGDEALAALGGFFGGVIVGSAVSDHHHQPVPVYPAVAAYASGPQISVGVTYVPRGHWRWTTVRVWVPGRWVVAFDDCGRHTRYYQRGYFQTERRRVWIEAQSRGGHNGPRGY